MMRLLPFVFLIVVFLAVAIGAPLLLQPDRHKGEIADFLSRQLHHHVLIGKAGMSFFPPALQLQDVSVMTEGDEAVLARIQRIDVQPTWSDLFKARFVPRIVTLQQWVLTVRRRPDASWDWNSWWPSNPGGAGTGGLPEQVIFHGGECHWVDAYGPVSQEMALQQVEGQLQKNTGRFAGRLVGGPAPLALTFEAQGIFGGAHPVWSGELKGVDDNRQWAVHVVQKEGAFDAKGESPEWRADSAAGLFAFYSRWGSATRPSDGPPVLFKDWKNHFSWQASSMTFYHSATVGGGFTELKGDIVSMGGRPAALHLTGALQNVALSDLGRAIGETLPAEGKLTGIGRFELAITSRPWSTLSGQGYGDIQAGQLRFPERTLRNLAKAKTMDYLKSKYLSLMGAGIPFKHLRAHWDAARGMISIRDGFFDAGDVKASWAGRLDGSRHGLDLSMRLQIRETDRALFAKIPGHYVYGAPRHESILPGNLEVFHAGRPAGGNRAYAAGNAGVNESAAQHDPDGAFQAGAQQTRQQPDDHSERGIGDPAVKHRSQMDGADAAKRQPGVIGQPVRLMQLERRDQAGHRADDQPQTGENNKHEHWKRSGTVRHDSVLQFGRVGHMSFDAPRLHSMLH